jgi:thiamine transporter ThiT
MTFRELRNKAVFFTSGIGFFYLYKHVTTLGLTLNIAASVGSAIACVVIIAIITDRFMD